MSQSDPETPSNPDFEVIDDLEEHVRAAGWARAEMLENGRAPDDLIAELVQQGWEEDAAADVVEKVRKETRAQRGVVTRDDVVRDINRHYRKSTSGWAVGIPSIASLRRLLHSIATMSILKPKK
jgi:hypothetical protein